MKKSLEEKKEKQLKRKNKLKEKLERKKCIKNGEDKFIMNMFNQIQMSVNTQKTIFCDLKGNEYTRSEFFDFIDNKITKDEINIFIYNLSFKEGDNFLRNEFYDDIKNVIGESKEAHQISIKKGFFKNNEWKNKIIFFDYNAKINKLIILTPFSVKNNMGNFFECFKAVINKTSLKSNYYRINGFKLLFIKSNKDIEYDYTTENIGEFFKNQNENVNMYFMKTNNDFNFDKSKDTLFDFVDKTNKVKLIKK